MTITQILLDTIQRIVQDKQRRKVAPVHATRREVCQMLQPFRVHEIDAAAEALKAEGRIHVGDTINDKYYI